MTIDEIIEEFKFLDDWQEKYKFIIDLGKKINPLDELEKTDSNKVNGCTSQVWLINDTGASPTMIFRGDSDSHIVRGLVYILLSMYSGKTPEEILSINIESIFNQLELKGHLSPNRSNGFFSMVNYIKYLAESNLTVNKQK